MKRKGNEYEMKCKGESENESENESESESEVKFCALAACSGAVAAVRVELLPPLGLSLGFSHLPSTMYQANQKAPSIKDIKRTLNSPSGHHDGQGSETYRPLPCLGPGLETSHSNSPLQKGTG